jgi:hypothetical protein
VSGTSGYFILVLELTLSLLGWIVLLSVFFFSFYQIFVAVTCFSHGLSDTKR